MKENFTVSPRILSHLGEDLIKNESIALLELVKNSYDACAIKCQVEFKTDDEDNLTEIIITDDGFGMDLSIIKTAWLTIGTNYKNSEVKEPNSCGRIPLGEKGIGRLGIHKLGNRITLVSKKQNSKEVSLFIDWRNLDKVIEIEDFKIEINENDTPSVFLDNTGTKIIIQHLKTKWGRRQIREVYRALTSLNSPFGEKRENFLVDIQGDDKLFSGLPKFDEIKDSGLYYGECSIQGSKIVEFKYEFKPWNTLTKIDKGRTKNISELLDAELEIVDEKKRSVNLNNFKIGKIKFEVIIYEKEAQILNYVNVEKKAITDYLKENGGIRVYRDGMRVYDYGERENDWLGIDLRRVSRVGGRISNSIVLGSVKIDRKDSTDLIEKTNREGFIENEAYLAFKTAVNYVLSLITKERNIDKQQLATLYKKHKVIEPVLSDLDEVLQIVEEKIEHGETRNKLFKYIGRITTQYKEVKEILIKSANAGLNLVVVIHEIDKLTAQLTGCIKRHELDKAINISQMLESIIRGYMAMIKKSSIKKASLSYIVDMALSSYEFRFSDHNIEVISNHKQSDYQPYLAEAEAISVLINLMDNSIYWLGYARKENRRISIYLTDSFKGFYTMVVSDNGPGFNIPTDIAIEPFITGKPHNIGSGIGLHVANEMMKAMNGTLMFLDEQDFELPEMVKKNGIDRATIALCFRIEK